MARSGGGGYNLTVQLNLQGPSNVNQIVNNINRQLGNIQANVNVNLPASVASQLAKINRQMQQTSKAANDATNGMERFGRAAGLAIKRFGAFTAATAGFYAITRATQQSLEKFIEFDRQITRIAQVTNTTKQSLSGLSSEITKLAVSLGVSSSDLAAVSVTLSQAGLSARETEKALKALALTTLAPTFNDINQTVEGSIALMKQFTISTSQLEKALGSINAVAGSFAVESGDLITAIQRAGGVFAAASQGVSTGTDALNEFLAVFTSVRATTRESAETIATGLRTIFTRIQREETIGALEAFGVQLTDLEGKFVGPYKAVEQLAKGLGRLDPRSLEFSSIIEELGGFRQVGKVIPLIQRFSTAQQALNVAQQGSGSLARDAAVGQQSLAVQISKVKEEFDSLIRSIGETSEFKQFIRLSLDLASALIQVADAIKPVLPAIAALGAIKIAGGIGSFARGVRGGFNSGARGFNSGGLVPGSGNTDTVRANLTPGEYVIRKKAVEAIGVNNLARMNKYASGGKVKDFMESAPYTQDTKTAPSWIKKQGQTFKVSGLKANKFNPEDYFEYQKNIRQVNVNRLRSAKSKIARDKYYEYAKRGDYRARGIAFEEVLYQAGIVKSLAGRKKGITGGSPRLDALDATGVAEIKSTSEPVRDADISAKMIGSALNPIGNTDNVIRSRFTRNAKLDEQVNRFNLGNVTVYQDTTQIKLDDGKTQRLGVTKTAKATKAKPIGKANGGPVQRFGRGGRTMADRDAAFDQKFEGLVRNFETAPLGKRLAALGKATRAFQDYSIREMMVAKPQLQSVGSNITPALMLEGLRSGKIGYGTGIDPKFPKRTPVFFGEQLSRLTSAKRSGSTERTTDARTHKNFLKLLGIPEDQIKGISAKQLDKIISRSFRNTKKGVESKVAAYADVSNFKPGLIAYGKGQGTFGDVVKGFDSKIRSALANDPKLLSHYEGMLKTGTWSNYLAAGGKTGHMPALKKKLYSIIGVTERNLGGPIGRFGKGVSSEDTVPALLTPGEYVINARAASAIGERKLNQLNNADRIGYNKGGRVRFGNGKGPSPASTTTPGTTSGSGDTAGGGMAGVGGSFAFLFGLQAASSALQSTFDETTKSGAESAGAIQGFSTGLTNSIVFFELFKTAGSAIPGVGAALSKLAGPAGIAVAGLIAVGSAVVGYLNAQKELEKKLSQEKFTSSLDEATTALEDTARGTQGAIQTFNANMISAAQAAEQLRESQNQYRYSLIGSSLDFFAGADDKTDATRSRILQEEGTFAYLGSFFGDVDSKLRENQETFSERDRAVAAKEAENIAKMQIQRGSQIIDKGGSLRDVANAIGPEVREAMARSNIEVAKVLDQTSDPKQRERIINQEVGRQLTQFLGPLIQDREANAANQAAQQLQVALNRVFDAMKQNFAAVATNIESRFDQVAGSLSVSLGQTTIGYNSNATKSVLENTKAFSDNQVRGAIASTMPLLGNKGGRIGDLALASTRIEDQIGNIIDNVLLNANVAEGAKLSTIGSDLTSLISGLNLGSDVEKVINNQLKKAFERAREDLGDNAKPEEIRQRVQEIVENIPSLNGALDVVKEAMQTFANAQNKYSQVVQQVTQAVLKQKEYFNRASQIRRESRLELKKTLGEEIGLNEIIGNVMTAISNQTGGITNVGALDRQQRLLMEERNRLTARRDVISGRADSNPEFVSLTQRLAELDIQLAQNRSGLEMLASSSEIASAALSEYSRIVQQGQAKIAFAEQVATATPQQYEQMKDNFRQLENIIAGGAGPNLYSSRATQDAMMQTYAEGGNIFQMRDAGETALSQQRSGMLSLMKELKPFFGDNNKGFNESYEKVLRSFLGSTGRMSPAFEKMFQEMRGQTDRQQIALQVYERATQIQAQANQALANMINPMSALAEANRNLAGAINALARRMDNVPGFASGGPVYASQGKLVNMQPRGTDTVPAMLTPGEFVVNAKSTKKHRGLLERINGGGVPSVSDGVSYAQDGGIMGRAEMLYAARLRWYQENYGMGAQRLIPIQARNMIRRQVMQQLMMEEAQKQQGEAYGNWLNTSAGKDFITRRDNLAMLHHSSSPEYRRVLNLTPTQVLIEERRIQKEKERKERKQKVIEKRRKEREEAEEERLRHAAGGNEQRYQDLRAYVDGDERPQRAAPVEQSTKTEEDWTPFDNTSGGVVRQYNRDGTVTVTNTRTGESQTIGTGTSNKFLDRPQRQQQQTQPINTVSLEARAAGFLSREQNNLNHTRGEREQAYSGLGGRALYAVHWMQSGYGQAFYDDQIKEGERKIQRIQYAQSLLAKANDPNLPYKQRVEAYQEAHRILYGAHLNSVRFSGGPTEYNQMTQAASNAGAEMVFEGATGLIPVGSLASSANRARRAGQSAFSMSRTARTGSTAAKTGAETATTTATKGAKTGTTRTTTTGAKEGAETGEQVIRRPPPTEIAEKGLLPYETSTTGRIEIGSQGPRYNSVRVSQGTSSGTPFMMRGWGSRPYVRGFRQPGVRTGTASSNANMSLRYRPTITEQQATDLAIRSRLGYSSGGIVQPAYLSDGGNVFYNALNTDPLAYSYDSPFSKYASPREKSYDRIAQGFSGLGMGNFAASRGLGLDAAGRINFESQYGYSDPRSDERDFQTIFGYNRYPSFLAGGGLAKGTDKYPAMLSRGEMVMNAEATRRNAGILRAMNKSSGGMVNNGILYAAGGTDGPIGMSGGTTGGGLGVVLGGAAELSQSMNSFMSVSDFVAGSFNNLSNSLSLFTQMDFGVLNEGATMMQTASSIFRSAASSLNTPLSGFGQSVQSFVSQTSNLISAIARIGDVNGTINVTGRIDIPPIQVNVVGAEIVQRIVPDIESRIMSSIATSLANDYPGLDLSVGSPI